jgi:hypothetical protein
MTAVILPLVSTTLVGTLIGEFSQEKHNLNGLNGTTWGRGKNMK